MEMQLLASMEAYAISLERHLKEERELCESLASVVAYQRSLIPTLALPLVKLQNTLPSVSNAQPLDISEFSTLIPPDHRHCCTDVSLYHTMSQLIHQKLTRAVSPEIYEIFRRSRKFLHDRLIARRLYVWNRLSHSQLTSAQFPELDRSIPENHQPPTFEVKEISSSLLRQAQRIIGRDKNSRLRQFWPDMETLHWIEDRIGSDVTAEKLAPLHEDMIKTHQELLAYEADLEQQHHEDMVAQQFPAVHVVSDFERYRELSEHIGRKVLDVRTKLFGFHSDYNSLMNQFRDMTRHFEQGFAIPKLQKELEKLHGLSREDQEQSLKHRELLVVRQVLEHTKIKNPHPWTAREFVDSEVLEFDKAVAFAREKRFDAALEVIGSEFERYNEMERQLKEERDAVVAAKARAESERNRWYGKKSKPHDRQLQVQLAELKGETEKQYREFEELRLECERRMENVITRVKMAMRKIQKAMILPLTFESCLTAAAKTRAMRDWLGARIQADRERGDEIRGRIEEMEVQTKRLWEEIEELKQQYPTLVEKSEIQQPIDEEIDEKYQELHDAFHCQQCIRLGHRRPRDTVLAKCGHSYCKDCVDQLVRNRNRKCPVCSQPFDPAGTNSTNGVVEIKWPDKDS